MSSPNKSAFSKLYLAIARGDTVAFEEVFQDVRLALSHDQQQAQPSAAQSEAQTRKQQGSGKKDSKPQMG